MIYYTELNVRCMPVWYTWYITLYLIIKYRTAAPGTSGYSCSYIQNCNKRGKNYHEQILDL